MLLRRIKYVLRILKQKYVLLILLIMITIIYIELGILPKYRSDKENQLNQQKVKDDRQLYVYHFGRYIPFTKTKDLIETHSKRINESLKTVGERSVRPSKHLKNPLPSVNKPLPVQKKKQNHKISLALPTRVQRMRTTEGKRCTFTQHPFFPFCPSKVVFMKHFWNKDECFYEANKVDGTDCTIYKYLTEIEPYCAGQKEIYEHKSLGIATMNYDLNSLLGIYHLKDYEWMKSRTSYLWPSWLSAAKNYSTLRAKRKREVKNVLVYPGSLAANHFLFELAGKGGPLGELIQWSDLVAALYVLGYKVTFVTEMADLKRVLKVVNKTDCALGLNKANLHTIYTDINGFFLLGNTLGSSALAKFRCMIRILDTFGTFPEFNFPGYPHKIPGGRASWSDLNLIPTQFLTLYPHTSDNRFLGFVIPKKTKDKVDYPEKNNFDKDGVPRQKALLYAKHANYISGYEKYLEVINEYFDIHATCLNNYPLPSYIHNHGPVSTERIQEMLSDSKVFIGVGFPFEGPGPLEAMANGAIYIQPKFPVPLNKLNSKFFAGKPTLRNLTSQNPYMEDFVGEPYCYTVDLSDDQELRTILEKVKSMERLPPKIPKEFTPIGLIERAHAFTEYVDYCNPYAPPWPPTDHLQTFFSQPGQSCASLCRTKGLICERTFFNEINKVAIIERLGQVRCSEVKIVTALHPPSVSLSTNICFIQNQQQTFSCMNAEEGVSRICPCRNFEKEQSAICENCL